MVQPILHINAKPTTVHFSCTSNHNPSFSPPTTKPSAVKVATNAHPYWASLQADIEAHLKQAMPIREPRVVFEPMHHLAFSAPRSTVPALCLAACELVGGHRHQAMAAASALMLSQAASYTHEHLPLTKKPKPKPVISHAYGPNIELLTGDGILPFGFELLSRSYDPARENSERVLRVIVEISRAVGSEGVIDAQYRRAMLGGSDGGETRHVEGVRRMLEKREGGLHACAGACGAVLGGGSEEEIERLRRYGFHVGMVQGMLSEGLLWEEVEEVRKMALKELEFFMDRGVDAISSFIHVQI